jgi:hypothetical protein
VNFEANLEIPSGKWLTMSTKTSEIHHRIEQVYSKLSKRIFGSQEERERERERERESIPFKKEIRVVRSFLVFSKRTGRSERELEEVNPSLSVRDVSVR